MKDDCILTSAACGAMATAGKIIVAGAFAQ